MTTLGLLLGSVVAAAAATSHGTVTHADGAPAGEVWFNSGNHAAHAGHPEHGFNSFTIKDLFCGDGWGIGVEWRLSDGVFTHQSAGDCEPVELTYETGQAINIVVDFNWRPYMWAVDGLHETEYGSWSTDWMGSDSTEGDTDLFTRTSVYNDVLGEGHTFTASMWPTALARVIGAGATPAMWRDLQERTPLPSSLSEERRESLYKQLWCHAAYGRLPQLGGPTWDIEAERPNISWWRVAAQVADHGCNW
ncbi:hypothetical protein BU204_30390 [Actinophytocola xanthii]|uniref:DUF2599 domain-containing protein n=1 Tax=Actinophytocola xanthii TaxID=1912961 RepID=A0A1Q8CAD0_9PSEU|nr:hypothetical protein BU204_30390 [Actinophytocola xanthii]